MAALTPQMGKIFLIIINVAMLLWSYYVLMKQYNNEAEYQGSISMALKYFHTVQEATQKTKEGHSQVMKMIVTYALPPFIYVFVTDWLLQYTGQAMIRSIISNALILLIFGGMAVIVHEMFSNNQMYPFSLRHMMPLRGSVTRVVIDMLRKRIGEQINTGGFSFYNKYNAYDPLNVDYAFLTKPWRQIHSVDIEKMIVKYQHEEWWQPLDINERITLGMYFNNAQMTLEAMADQYDQQSDEEKHKEFMRNKHTSQIMFLVIAAIIIMPLI